MSDAETLPSAEPHAEHIENIEEVHEESRGGRRRAPKKSGIYSEMQDLRSRLDEQQASLEAIKSAFNTIAISLNGHVSGSGSGNLNGFNSADAGLMRRLFPAIPAEEERRGRRPQGDANNYHEGGGNAGITGGNNYNPRYRNGNSNYGRGGYGPRYGHRHNSNNRSSTAFE